MERVILKSRVWQETERRVLVTLDMDFSNILHYPPGDYAGVIVLRVPKPTRHRVAVTLKEFLAAVKETDIEHSLIIVEPGLPNQEGHVTA